MNDLPRQKLCELIARYGPGLADEPQKCEALLRDVCGKYRREIFVLVNALREQVAGDLLTDSEAIPLEAVLVRLSKRLEEHTAFFAKDARWAVESWALALGKMPRGRVGAPPADGAATGQSDPLVQSLLKRIELLESERKQTTPTPQAPPTSGLGSSYVPKAALSPPLPGEPKTQPKYKSRFRVDVTVGLIALIALSTIGLMNWRGSPTSRTGSQPGRVDKDPVTQGPTPAPENPPRGSHWPTPSSQAGLERARKAAERGDTAAMVALGRCYESGAVVERAERTAYGWYLKAAEAGDPEGLNKVGVCYLQGEGVPKNVGEALRYFQRSATLDNADGIDWLGFCYENGVGVEKDEAKALDLYRRAARLGLEFAQKRLTEKGLSW